MKFFEFTDASIDCIPLKIQRSGYSKQGGFELYLMDGTRGVDLWNIARKAGQPLGIGPSNPDPVERIEGGLLSFGGDTDNQESLFEVRLGKYVTLDLDDDVIGIKALREIHARGPKRHQMGVVLDSQPQQPGHAVWHSVYQNEQPVGHMTNGGWSPRFETMIGFVLVDACITAGDRVNIIRNGQMDAGTICALLFVD